MSSPIRRCSLARSATSTADQDWRGYNFSHLNVWQANLADIELPEVNFHGADLAGSRFTEAFKTIVPVAFSPDGRYMAAGSIDGEIWLWRVVDKQQVGLFQGHTGPVNTIAFSPNNQILASGSSDGLIMLWSLTQEGGVHLATLSQHSSRVWSVAFSPDGALLASGSADQTVRLWSIASGQCLAILNGHNGEVVSLAFSVDGRLLASGNFDGTIKLWDVLPTLNAGAGACLATLNPKAGVIYALAFNPNGPTFASSGAVGLITLWDLPTRQLAAILRNEGPYLGMNITAATGLTAAQWATLRGLGAVEM